jgi:uncharacterized protein YqcC (DUF446 family)
MDQLHDNNGTAYAAVEGKANEIEAELRALGRWSNEDLPHDCYENMGAFGSNTMAFEQWLQFILIPRIRQIIEAKDNFPSGSQLASYAIRVFNGDPESNKLHELLYDLDKLINNSERPAPATTIEAPVANTITLGDETIPPVLYTLAELLPQFSAEDLESQLQTFDALLAVLSTSARKKVSELLSGAAASASDITCRKRIEQAANNVANGQRAAEPYDHELAMKKYRKEFKKGYN